MKAKAWAGLLLASLLLAAAGAGLGYWYGRGQAPKAQPATTPDRTSTSGPVARVRVTTIKRGPIAAHLIAYGTVVAAQGKGRAFTLPYESRVSKVLAVPGQEVVAGSVLLELAPSTPASLQLAQARSQQNSAGRELALLRRQMKLGLATRQQVLQAKKNLDAAELNLRSLRREGAGRPRAIRARAPGVVSRVLVRAGQLVPAGSPLVETIASADLEVRLGIESEDVSRMRVGQAVRMRPINKSSPRVVFGRVRLIARQVDPKTRLVSIYVAPEGMDHTLLLNEYVQGRLTAACREGLWVPPAAVLPRQDGSHEIFTVKANRAVRHLVKTGLHNPRQVQVIGPDISQGQSVIVVGNSQVRDGMPVRVETSS